MSPGKYDAVGAEAECEPGSENLVLRNLLGITDPEEMDRAESEALEDALDALLAELEEDHTFTAEDVKMIHRTWLGNIYAWAGEYRTVDLEKPGIRFAHAAHLGTEMARFERECLTAYTPCRGDERLEEALAVIHGELILIHPFREGNGRCARVLADLMAAQAGLPTLDFGPMAGDGQTAYFEAIRTIWTKSDYLPLKGIFEAVVKRSLETEP